MRWNSSIVGAPLPFAAAQRRRCITTSVDSSGQLTILGAATGPFCSGTTGSLCFFFGALAALEAGFLAGSAAFFAGGGGGGGLACCFCCSRRLVRMASNRFMPNNMTKPRTKVLKIERPPGSKRMDEKTAVEAKTSAPPLAPPADVPPALGPGAVDVEKFSKNIARMVEEAGKALAAYLKPREEGE